MVDVIDSRADKAKEGEMPFFVVSPMKSGVMIFFTFNLYWLYCFYQSWKLQRASASEAISPFWRSAFAIFFIYPLLKRADDHIRNSGRTYPWRILSLTLASYATFAIAIVASFVLAEQIWLSYAVGLAIQLAWLVLLLSMQKGLNFSAGEVAGESNSKLTASNWVWILICSAIRVAQLFALIQLSSMM
ncbi:hypothetical protein [Pseudomonas sp. NPDC089401]|uniref:hypothetical protein n=1 Tax=Pseudomonas sp. NPDC089401 TaxID=3364462 RepID=UPI00380128D0